MTPRRRHSTWQSRDKRLSRQRRRAMLQGQWPRLQWAPNRSLQEEGPPRSTGAASGPSPAQLPTAVSRRATRDRVDGHWLLVHVGRGRMRNRLDRPRVEERQQSQQKSKPIFDRNPCCDTTQATAEAAETASALAAAALAHDGRCDSASDPANSNGWQWGEELDTSGLTTVWGRREWGQALVEVKSWCCCPQRSGAAVRSVRQQLQARSTSSHTRATRFACKLASTVSTLSGIASDSSWCVRS